MQNIFKIILFSFSLSLKTTEYLYPITTIEDETVFYIYQKNLADLELWRFFLNDQHQEKCLDWRYIPAGLKILSDKSGFSFIDAGRLRIKNFLKRACRTIEFHQPVFGVSEINWVSKDDCYFSARQKTHFAIFKADVNHNQLTMIQSKKDLDCLSPRILEQQLFYIERNAFDRSSFICRKLLSDKQDLQIVDCGYQQVIYLEMLSPELGWYIEHMPYINDDSDFITFVCHKIELISVTKNWSSQKIFKFNVLKKYLIGDDRLYESYIPFLPRTKKTSLYFTNIQRNESQEYYSSINSYDLTDGKFKTIITSEPSLILFAPILVSQELFYGKISENGLLNESQALERIKL